MGDARTEPAPIVDIDGARVTIAICFDLHFLDEDAQAALDACDLLLFPSAWVEEHDSRPRMLARSRDAHRIAIANANWGPGVVRIRGQGGSSILDAGAVEVLARVAARAASHRVMRADADGSGGQRARTSVAR